MPDSSTEQLPSNESSDELDDSIQHDPVSKGTSHPFEEPLELHVDNTEDDVAEAIRFRFYRSQKFKMLIAFEVVFLAILLWYSHDLDILLCYALSVLAVPLSMLFYAYGEFVSLQEQYAKIRKELFNDEPPRCTILFDRTGMRVKDIYSGENMIWEKFRLIDRPVRQNGNMILLYTLPDGDRLFIIPKRALPQGLTIEKLAADLERAIAHE